MGDSICLGCHGRGRPTELEFAPLQPLEGFHRLIVLTTVPATWRFDGDGVWGQMFLAPVTIAGACDSDAFLHGIELSVYFEFSLEFLTSGFEQFYVRRAVGDHFLLQIEHHVVGDLFLVPRVEFCFLLF